MTSSVMDFSGLAAGVETGISKTARASMADRDILNKVLDVSAKRPVIMYDIDASSGWVGPEICVILHLTRSWFIEREDLPQNEIDKLPYAPLTEDGGRADFDALKNEKHKALRFRCTNGNSTWSFFNTVKDATKMLRNCRETRYLDESTELASSLFSWFHLPTLHEWDMADRVESRDSTLMKEISIKKNSRNKWMSVIANHPDI